MSRIAHVRRVGARYHYRRRVHLRKIISRPVTVSLQTADPAVARVRAAMLSARFAIVMGVVKSMHHEGRDFLTGPEIHALIRGELEQELARAIAPSYDSEPHARHMAGINRITAEAYDIARRPDRPTELSVEDEETLIGRGFGPLEIEFIAQDLEAIAHADGLESDTIATRLAAIGAPVNPVTVDRALPHLLRARWEAYHRASHLADPRVRDATDPVEMLLTAEFAPTSATRTPTVSLPQTSLPAAGSDGPFLAHDSRRFSDIIEDVIGQLRQEERWRGNTDQQRRIMRTFAWITGNKPLGDYNHLDVDAFKRGLMRLPASFSFGSPAKGAMARPFAAVVAELPTIEKGQERNNKTVNRDLSTMSTVAKHLAQTAWRSKIPGAVVMDFAAATVAIRDTGVDPRPPWTRSHLELLFNSPIYRGGGGGKKRLQRASRPAVFHDAAYFAPLLWYYQHACREEICGLRADEVDIDHEVPHFVIKNNDIRGADGELKGEKRIARRRALPLHPELIRLGFSDYVRAIRAEGHIGLFPELFVNAEKRGGAQFYGVAWRFMVDWIADRLPLPINAKGKGPDIHSIRALGSSFYEIDGVNEIVRADIMGHARSGTNAKHYSKRIQTEGLDVVLPERLEFLRRYVPVITSDVPAMALCLLPLDQRSRVGSGRHRKMRSDRGQPRD